MGFTIPSMLRGVQSISAEILAERGMRAGNYEFLLREVESLYLPVGLVELDEYGLPLPLGVKLIRLGLSGESVADMLIRLQEMSARPDVMSRLSTVEQWILQDVVAGLGVTRG